MGLRLRVQPRPLKTSNVAWREPFSPGAGGAKKAGEYVILHSAIVNCVLLTSSCWCVNSISLLLFTCGALV
jgi:hypothetical protein